MVIQEEEEKEEYYIVDRIFGHRIKLGFLFTLKITAAKRYFLAWLQTREVIRMRGDLLEFCLV